MPTERLDIVVSERGSRRVSRNIAKVGTAARTAQGGVSLLRSALGALGGARAHGHGFPGRRRSAAACDDR